MDSILPVKLRFKDKHEEKRFKECLELQLVRNGLVAIILWLMGMTLHIAPRYAQEVKRMDKPWNFDPTTWDIRDARSEEALLTVANWVFVLMIATIMILRLWRGLGKGWHWEGTTVTGLCACAMHIVYATELELDEVWAEEPNRRAQEVLSVLILASIVTASCLFLHVRVHIFWVVPCVVIVAFTIRQVVEGSNLESITVLFILGCLCIFALTGAVRHERHIRRDWQSAQQVVELSAQRRGMQTVVETLCDIVLKVSNDVHICDTSTLQSSFFGCQIEGMPFTALISEADKPRFSQLLRLVDEVKFSAQCLPVTFPSSSYGALEATLVVVDTGRLKPRYLIGIKADRCELGVQGVHNVPTYGDHLEAPHARHVDDLDHSQCGAVSHLPGSVTTTEIVFQHLDMEQIISIGESEGWLLPPADVMISSELLGSGGFGVVHRGQLFGTPVALKVPLKEAFKDISPMQRLKHLRSLANELRVLRTIHHPNIALFHGACVSQHSMVIALEVVWGEQLNVFLNDGDSESISSHHRHCVLDGICCALWYLHAHRPRIVHGDLKDSNILVELRGSKNEPLRPHAKLIDFGLANMLSMHATSLGGTVGWMAPEVMLAKSGVALTTSSDIFSFGCVLYMVTTGERPFRGWEEHALLAHIRNCNTMPPLRWPEQAAFRTNCELLCNKCLQVSAADRPLISDVHSEFSTWPITYVLTL